MLPTPSATTTPSQTSNVSLPTSPRTTLEVMMTRHAGLRTHDRSGRKMVNQYIVMEQIGRGQHGKVRRGIDSFTAETVAIKIVERVPKHRRLGMGNVQGRPHARAPGGAVNNFMRTTEDKIKKEIAIMKKCHHDHIVQLKEVIDDPHNKRIFLILEYMEGGDVKWQASHIDNAPLLTVEETRRIFRDTILGLEYLHYQGIIHRDIKPQNLLLTADGTVKISDFGVSHFSHALRLAAAGTNSIRAVSPGPSGKASGDGEGSSRYNDDEILKNDSDLAKTMGSPAFFAPELCHQNDFLPSMASLSPSLNDSQSVNESPRSPASGTTITASSSSTPAKVSCNTSLAIPATSRSALTPSSSTPSSVSGATLTPCPSPGPPVPTAIDVWALGITLYCLLFGRTPFSAPTEFALYKVISTEDFAIPDTMGRDKKKTGGRSGAREARKRAEAKGKAVPTMAEEKAREEMQDGWDVVSVLEKLLEKDPSKRITLHDLKRTRWVLRGIEHPGEWLMETDPRKEEIVVVQEEDVAGAFKRARFKQVFQKFKEKTKGAAMGILGRLRSRSTSSVNALGGDGSDQHSAHDGTGAATPTQGALSKKKSKRTSYSQVNVQHHDSSGQKAKTTRGSRDSSPSGLRSPINRWNRLPHHSEPQARSLPTSSFEAPRSASPISGCYPSATVSSAPTSHLSSPGEDTLLEDEISSSLPNTPRPRRSSASLLSPPSQFRRAISMSTAVQQGLNQRAPVSTANDGTGHLRRNKTEAVHKQMPIDSEEKSKSLGWLSRLGSRHNKRKAATTSVTPTSSVGSSSIHRPGALRSASAVEPGTSSTVVENGLRFRPSHEFFTDDSSVGGRSFTDISPITSRDEGVRAPRPIFRQDGFDEDDEGDGTRQFYSRASTDSQASFDFSDDSVEEYDDDGYDPAADTFLAGGGGYPIHNTGSGWQPLISPGPSSAQPATAPPNTRSPIVPGLEFVAEAPYHATEDVSGTAFNRHISSPLAQELFGSDALYDSDHSHGQFPIDEDEEEFLEVRRRR